MKPASLTLALAFSLAPGCKCNRDKPYVPYSIDDKADAAADAGVTATAAAIDAGPAGLTMVRAPAGAKTLAVLGSTMQAPAGQVFVAAAPDGDDVAAVLKSETTTSAGTLYAVALYRGVTKGPSTPVVVASSSPLVACGRDQEVPVRVTRRGASSLVFEVGASCGNRAPSRWLLVVAKEGAAPRARFSVGIADPPGAQPLGIEAEPSDRDGDGIDDVVLRVALEGGVAPFEPGPKVAGTLVWLDRTAGLSRDPSEPEASFKAVSGPLSQKATRSKEAAQVPLATRQLRHLAHALCIEGGASRLVGLAGATLPSCSGSRALEDAGLAEARAYVTLGDSLRAAFAFERAGRAPAAKTPARQKETQASIEKLAPPSDATSIRSMAAVPDEPPRDAPAFGPLAFEADGKLLVRTKAGVVRADPATGDESDAGKAAWPSVVGGEGKPVFAMALNPCDGVALRAVFTKPEQPQGAELALPIVPTIGERCVVPRSEPAPARVLAWGASGLEAVVAGEPILVATDATRASLLATPLDAPGEPGSAKSPDGHSLVMPTTLGLMVRNGTSSRLLRARELDGKYAELRYCTVANDGHRVACVRNRRVVAGIWEP